MAQSCWHLFLLTTSVITWPGVIIVHSASLKIGKVKRKVKMESESASPYPTALIFLMSTVITWLRTGFTRTLALERYLLKIGHKYALQFFYVRLNILYVCISLRLLQKGSEPHTPVCWKSIRLWCSIVAGQTCRRSPGTPVDLVCQCQALRAFFLPTSITSGGSPNKRWQFSLIPVW